MSRDRQTWASRTSILKRLVPRSEKPAKASIHNGKAEILLTPGVFLRLGNNSSVKMISPSLTNTELALSRGKAMVEVDEIHSQNDIRIRQPGATTRVLRTGLYSFDAEGNGVKVFNGKASVEANDHQVTVKGGHELA